MGSTYPQATIRLYARRDRLSAIKLQRGCSQCGYRAHAAALHFHHMDPRTKLHNVASMLTAPWERVEAEILKCVVICANCHAALEGTRWLKGRKY